MIYLFSTCRQTTTACRYVFTVSIPAVATRALNILKGIQEHYHIFSTAAAPLASRVSPDRQTGSDCLDTITSLYPLQPTPKYLSHVQLTKRLPRCHRTPPRAHSPGTSGTYRIGQRRSSTGPDSATPRGCWPPFGAAFGSSAGQPPAGLMYCHNKVDHWFQLF